jgi:hypothetical protein
MAGPLKVTRELADKVRKIGLTEIIEILENQRDYGIEFRKQLLLKLAPTLLPRINEHTGADGAALTVNLVSYGNSDSLQLVARKTSPANSAKPGPVQNDSDAPESPEDNTGA